MDPMFAGGELAAMRRNPLYLLLDVSASMSRGGAIEGLRQGVNALLDELNSLPEAQTAYIKIIKFGDQIDATPLTHIYQFVLPIIDATGSETRLGEALQRLDADARFGADLIENVPNGQKGDWLPIVFIVTDGAPTDTAARSGHFETAAAAIKRRVNHREMNVIAIVCGSQARSSAPLMQQITDLVLVSEEANRERLRAIMRWVSQSIAVHSRNLSSDRNDGSSPPTQLPDPTQAGLVLWH